MANSVNKVVYDGRTLIDLTSDTVVAGAMRQNYTAHDKSGAQISGSDRKSTRLNSSHRLESRMPSSA